VAVLDDILDDNLDLYVRWRGDLSNHLSMAALALHALGGTDAELAAFQQSYIGNLQPLPPPVDAISSESWRTHLGAFDRYTDYLTYFQERVREDGGASVVDEHICELAPAIASDAFHPLIRLGYGIEFDRPKEIAAALAYWAATYLELPEPEPPTPGEHILMPEALEALRREGDPGPYAASTGLITPRLLQAADYPVYHKRVGNLILYDDFLEDAAQTARGLHAQLGSFATLHAVTACHALRVLVRQIPEHRSALESPFARAFLALYISCGCPYPDAEVALETEPPDWESIAKSVRTSTNDHAIKFVYTCRVEAGVYGHDDAYRHLAAKMTR
jgi:hypothetical protein